MPSIIIQKKFPYQKVGVKTITGSKKFVKRIVKANTGNDHKIKF